MTQTICYCHGYSDANLEDDVRRHGRSTIQGPGDSKTGPVPSQQPGSDFSGEKISFQRKKSREKDAKSSVAAREPVRTSRLAWRMWVGSTGTRESPRKGFAW